MVDIRITRILYMEDDPGLSRLLQKSLQRRGYLIDTASDGEEGLAKLAATPYDLLLVDYDMPFFGGIDVIRALCAKGPLMPTIMVTGQGNEEVAVEALKLGAVDYVVKDTEMKYLELLPVVIDRVLYRQHILQERKQMEDRVRESEERYRLLVELSPDGIAVHADGKFVFMNPAGARLLGASGPDQLIGQGVLDRMHPDYRKLATECVSLTEHQQNRTPWIEGKFVRFDRQTIDVELISVSSTYQGKPAVQMIFRDTSERKHMRDHL
jgi:PAS domain S-box-containing protein